MLGEYTATAKYGRCRMKFGNPLETTGCHFGCMYTCMVTTAEFSPNAILPRGPKRYKLSLRALSTLPRRTGLGPCHWQLSLMEAAGCPHPEWCLTQKASASTECCTNQEKCIRVFEADDNLLANLKQ